MVDPLYTTPAVDPVTPPFHLTEGYPLPPGLDPVPFYYPVPPGFPDVRATRRYAGIRSYDVAGVPQSIISIDADRFNATRRVWYRVYQNLDRFLWLNLGYLQYIASGADNADWLVDEADTAIFGKTWGPIDAVDGPGANQVTISWETGDTVDPRQLTRASDGVANSSIQVCDMVFDEEAAAYGRAQIIDIEFQGESVGVHSAVLTLDRPLLAARSDQVWIARENRLPTYPWISLGHSTAVCKHAIESAGNKLTSFATAYSAAYVSDYIDGQWWCDAMNDPTATGFVSACANVLCPLYEVHVPFYPDEAAHYLWNRGRYARQTDLGAPSFVRIGRENWEGLFLLLGLPVGYYAGLHHLPAKTVYGWGTLLYLTGATTDAGYAELLSFDGQQEKHRDNSEDEADAGTILDEFQSIRDRYDPAGGDDEAGDHLLVSTAARTPGYLLANAIGARKTGGAALNYGPDDVGLSLGYAGSVLSPQINLIQRVRPVTRNSRPFNLQTPGVTSDVRARVTVTSSPQAVPGLADTYTLKFETPRFGGRAVEAKSTYTPAIFSSSISGNLLTLEFELYEQILTTYPNPIPGDPDVSAPFDSGGYLVGSDIAYRLMNPGVGDGADRPRDPERDYLFPGDCISFDAEAVAGIEIQCLAAEAFGGSTDGAATAPNASLDGIPDYIRTNYAKRDKAIFSLEGSNGAQIEDWIDGLGGLAGQGISLVASGVRMSAVAPATIDYGENATGYDPVISKTDKATGTTAVVPAGEYVWDPVTGTAFIDASGWAAGDYVLQWVGWVYDVRKDYPCEDAAGIRDMLFEVCDHCFRILTPQIIRGDHQVFANYTTPSSTEGPTHDLATVFGSPAVIAATPFDESDPLIPNAVNAGATLARTYTQGASLGSGYTYGADTIDQPGQVQYLSDIVGAAISDLGGLARFRPADVAEARMEISFEDPTITTAWGRNVGGGGLSFSSDGTLTTINLALTVLSKTSGTEYDLGSPGISVPLTLTKIDISGTTYARGTVDMTAAVKYMIENLTTEGIEYLLLVVGMTPLPSGAITLADLVKSFVSANNNDGAGNSDTTVWKIQYDGVVFGNLYVRTEKTELANGPNLPYSSEGLFSDGPDLLYDPA